MQKMTKKKQSLSSSKSIKTTQNDKNLNQRENSIINMTSNRDCLKILVILMTCFILFSGVLSYSIFQSLSVANSRLQKIEMKFHKFLFYIRYIYKSEKTQQQMSQQQNNSITNFLNKISQGYQEKKQPKQINQKLISVNERSKKTIMIQKKQDQKSENGRFQLLSQEEMIDIAIKIIEQENHAQVKNTQSPQRSKLQIQVDPRNDQTLLSSDKQVLNISETQTQTFECNIDEQNIFYKNFQFNPQTLRLRKSKYTSSFQSIFCEQPIPKLGIYEFPIKILRTSKSFIYIGIVGGNKTQVYNKTSIHQINNFYGYSGYSGRIWQATKRKNSYEIFQTNTILKLRVNMNLSLLQYFFNDIKVGQSNFGKLCQEQCRFVIQMRDDGDQIQFLQTFKIDTLNIDTFNTTNIPVINQL